MTAIMKYSDIITIDDESDEETESSGLSSVNGGSGTGGGSATCKITNERPLDLSQFLNFSTAAPKEITSTSPPPQLFSSPLQQLLQPTQSTKPAAMTVNAPFMARPSFVPASTSYYSPIKNGSAVNGMRNERAKAYSTQNSPMILSDSNNRKRSIEPTTTRVQQQRHYTPPSTVPDKKPRLSAQQVLKDIHGSSNYIVSEPYHGFTTQDGEEFSGQFRCTSLNCNKVLSNNVSFMYHLWAHIGVFQRRDFSTESDMMTDEKFTRMCSVCLSVFETAFEKTRHYLEVHRGVFQSYRPCHLCETADHDRKHVNKIIHRENELPYECRRCKFRSSSRMALIDHFSKIHIGTTLLMCPFCPYTTQISASEKLKPVVFAKNYVQHVTEHGNVIAQKCSCCSYKFIDENCFEKHTKCHQIEQHKWPIQFKSFKSMKEEALKTKPRHEQLTLMKCVECNMQFPKAEDHFDKPRKCDGCSFESTCIFAFWNHIHLSECDPENKSRFELAVTKDENFVPPKCSSKIRKTLQVMKSKDFIQNFRMFRDFSYDRIPNPLAKSQEKTEIDLIIERREKIRNMTQARRVHEIPSYILDGIASSLYAEENDGSETMKFVRGMRVPMNSSLVEEFLAVKKQKEEGYEDVVMLDDEKVDESKSVQSEEIVSNLTSPEGIEEASPDKKEVEEMIVDPSPSISDDVDEQHQPSLPPFSPNSA